MSRLNIQFSETFAAPPAPVFAADGITGFFTNPGFVIGLDTMSFQGFVNGVAIAPPAGRLAVAAGPGAAPVFFQGGHGGPPPPLFVGGPPWILKGDILISLGAVGDEFVLPDSAAVGINGDSTIGFVPNVPEPTSLTVCALGGIAFCIMWMRSSLRII